MTEAVECRHVGPGMEFLVNSMMNINFRGVWCLMNRICFILIAFQPAVRLRMEFTNQTGSKIFKFPQPSPATSTFLKTIN